MADIPPTLQETVIMGTTPKEPYTGSPQQLGATLRPLFLTPRRTAIRPMSPRYCRLPVIPTAILVSAPETSQPETPKAPTRTSTAAVPRPTSDSSSEKTTPSKRTMDAPIQIEGYMYGNSHVGDPCTLESLDHLLGCGHKVITMQPEPCANNCHVRSPPDYSQPRDLDQAYSCMACVLEHIASRQLERHHSFRAELQAVAVEHDKPVEWVEQRLEVMTIAWQDEDVEEMKVLFRKGRQTQSLWIEPEMQELVDVAMMEARLGRRSSRSTLNRSPSPTPSVASTFALRRGSKIPAMPRYFQDVLKPRSRRPSASTTVSETLNEADRLIETPALSPSTS